MAHQTKTTCPEFLSFSCRADFPVLLPLYSEEVTSCEHVPKPSLTKIRSASRIPNSRISRKPNGNRSSERISDRFSVQEVVKSK